MSEELNCDSIEIRIIKTARNLEEINDYAKRGFFPLVKKVEKNPEIHSKFAVYQNKETGEVFRFGDFRMRYRDYAKHLIEIIPFTRYYPYSHDLPFAAYIIPPDIKIGEKVFIEDLIPDLVGATWNQGDVYRLESCEAIWNGTDLDLQYDEEKNVEHWMG